MEVENYSLASQFYQNNKSDSFVQQLEWNTRKDDGQLMRKWLRNRDPFTEFTKSLIESIIYFYKYKKYASTPFPKINPKDFTRYHLERVKASYAIKNTRLYNINNALNFCLTTLSVPRNVGRLYYKTYLMPLYEDKSRK